MLRKALEKAGLDYIPVLSLSFGLEKNPGFHWTVGLIRRLIYGMMYGDLIMNLSLIHIWARPKSGSSPSHP